ncbi:peroxidase [Frondihabitans sp. Leaf304]|nr:peroxidase [Frondihabitans sp. Leaf304]
MRDRQTSVPTDDETAPRPGLSRRGLLGLAGVGLGAGVIGAGSALGIESAVTSAAAASSGANTTYPFYATHQSGIVTAAQDRLHFAAFDIASGVTREELVDLLKDWSYAAGRMTRGQEVSPTGATGGSLYAPPDDTGEALGLPASGLTITIGFGPSLFDDRFGLASKRPPKLIDLPEFPGDNLNAAASDGDLCIQACSDDPQVAVHAIRNLSRIAFGRASLRWSQLGFGRTSSTTRGQTTPRNLFGFKDGTANLKAEDTALVRKDVWAQGSDGAAWMANGTYLVSRKIRMHIETWDHQSLKEQQVVVGRDKGEGAPLSGGTELSSVDFTKKQHGVPLVATTSHVSLAHPEHNGGAQLLRRGYNFVDGNDDLGRLNAGLFFISFQRDPEAQFVRIQNALAANDAMGEYLQHVSSGIFAVPQGARAGGYVGETLFA